MGKGNLTKAESVSVYPQIDFCDDEGTHEKKSKKETWGKFSVFFCSKNQVRVKTKKKRGS